MNNRKLLDGLLESLGLLEHSGAVLRALDKLAKVGPDQVRAELVAASLSAGQADRVLELRRGGPRRSGCAGPARPGTGRSCTRGRRDREPSCRGRPARCRGGASPCGLAVDLGLARGLDYYTGIVFETTVNGWERFGSISSGGRYDNLASLFTDRKLPGVGASIGLDRLLALLEEAGWLPAGATTAPVLVANFPGVDAAVLVRLAARLRGAGIGAEVFPEPIQTGKQMGYGSSRGHRLALIVGPDELGREVFNLRNLATRQEEKAIPWRSRSGSRRPWPVSGVILGRPARTRAFQLPACGMIRRTRRPGESR